MKILIASHNFVRGDGQGRVNLELALACIRKGWEVQLVADSVDDQLLLAGANWTPVTPRIRRPVLGKVIGFARTASNIVRQERTKDSVVVATGWTLNIAHHVNICHFVHHGWRRVRNDISDHQPALSCLNQTIYNSVNTRMERSVYSKAQRVVAVSEPVRKELIGIGVGGGRIEVIPNGVDVDEFRPRDQDRDMLHLPPGPLAVFVGDIRTRRKNLETVLKALVAVPGLRLAVVGDASRSPFPGYAEELNIADRVVFLGFRDDVANILPACDFMVFPSRYEPFGLVITEAMACGLPVITSRQTGASSLVEFAGGIVLDDPNDVECCAAAMHHFSEGDQLAHLSKRARTCAEANSWQSVGDKYAELFARMRGT